MNSLIEVLKFKFNSGMVVVNKLKEFCTILTTSIPLLNLNLSTPMREFIFLILVFTLTTLINWNPNFLLNQQIKLYFYIMGSFHPNNCKTSIIYSQALRYVRLITNRNILSERLQDLRVNLITRGYTNNVIDNAFNKVLQYTQSNPPN
jgi:hypothetical protein